jgi:hypothetical protein
VQDVEDDGEGKSFQVTVAFAERIELTGEPVLIA